MHWEERFNNLILDKNRTIHAHVQSVPSINFHPIIFQRQ
jgi:hypothetical protein